MFTIKTNNKELVFESEIRVNELINDVNKEFPVAKVNNRLRELSYLNKGLNTVWFNKISLWTVYPIVLITNPIRAKIIKTVNFVAIFSNTKKYNPLKITVRNKTV